MTDQEKASLTAALDQAVADRGGDPAWTRQAVLDAMQVELAAGSSAAEVASAVTAAATDPATRYPGRLGYLLRQGVGSRSVAPPPDWARGPIKYLSRGTPTCRKVGHRGEPERGCGKCKVDELVAARLDEPDPSPRPEEVIDGLTGRELARRMAATAGHSLPPKPRGHGDGNSTSSEVPSKGSDLAAAAR